MTNLDVKLRDKCGTMNSCRLREEGLIPAIIYGGKTENVMVSINAKQLNNAVKKGLANFELHGDVTEKVVLKAVQYDGMGSTVLHVDLVRV